MYSLNAYATTKRDAKSISIQAASIVVHSKPTSPPPIPRLKFSTPATGASVKVGQCQPLEIAIDESGIGQTAPIKNTFGDIRISLRTSSLTGSYFRDSGCTDRMNVATFALGAINLAGDKMLLDKLRSPSLLPLGNRIKTRIQTESLSKHLLTDHLTDVLTKAGNPVLMTKDLKKTLIDHSGGNCRVLTTRASKILIETIAKNQTQNRQVRGCSILQSNH
jgi:hypothetical protein